MIFFQLTTRQIEDIISKIYESGYSKSSVSRITTGFSSYIESWLHHDLDHYYPVVYIDALHIKIRRKTVATEPFLGVIRIKRRSYQKMLAIVNIPWESASGWQEVLENIRSPGVSRG